jgi:phosphatidylglycerol:prolipoprotein diacylglycerol transferase
MYPKLFEIGPFPIYSFGVMLALGFLAASYLLTAEFKRRKLDPDVAGTVTFLALVLGVAGSKLFHLLENFSAFLSDPIGMAFSPGGLTFHGGLLAAIAGIAYYVRKKGIPFLVVADATSPGLILAYGIGRVGCHLAGDGDYGFPTNLPWGTDYSAGTYPPSAAFRNFPEVTGLFPDGVVPDTILCHPTPVYEFIAAALIAWYLWRLRTRFSVPGMLFSLYLVLSGLERFLVEFLRLNPRLLLGLSQAQLISLGLVVAGIIGFAYLRKRPAGANRT